MDYDNLNSNLKYNIEHTMGYADVGTSTDLVNKFILEKANDHNYEVIDLLDSYYIKKGVAPKAIIHLNTDSNFLHKNLELDQNDGARIIAGKNIYLFNAIFVIAALLDLSTNDFDVLITNNNIQKDIKNYSSLKDIIRSDNVINLNLHQSRCIADEFSALNLLNIKVPVLRKELEYSFKTFRLSLNNLIGGHTGEDLDKVRVNSIKATMGLVRKIKSKVDLDILKLQGGDRYDYIPNFASVDFAINCQYENELINTFKIYKNEYIEKNLKYEPDMDIDLSEITVSNINPISDASFSYLSSFVELIPTGAYAVNSNNNQLISSLNLSTVRTFEDYINFIIVLRSLSEESMNEMLEKVKTAASISNSKALTVLSLPRWKNSDTSLTEIFTKSYEELTGDQLEVVKTQYSLDSSMIFFDLDVNIVSLGVEYKQRDDNMFFTDLADIIAVINVIDNVLTHIKIRS
ncbi:hypothetical protein [Anaerococcus sp.]|uniref:hypothetical protein n=1 Tax=Anaerococcus sp. TaxID=1872515 RepID=UPI00257F2BC3|nr:hypothetical protein [Anaerococcus sp.]MBS6105751.1 hypothetical protein [Anaerococcus sp.]MDU4025419.1 hypothetical protein [Anaerococcus sp.]